MITGRSCSTCQMQCKCCFTYRRTGSNNDLLTGLPAACHPVKVGKSSSQSCSTVLVAGHAGLYQLIVSSMSCDVERRCSAVPHSFSNRSRRVWAFASVSSFFPLKNYTESSKNKLLPLRTVHGSHEAASQKIDYPLFKIF